MRTNLAFFLLRVLMLNQRISCREIAMLAPRMKAHTISVIDAPGSTFCIPCPAHHAAALLPEASFTLTAGGSGDLYKAIPDLIVVGCVLVVTY